MMYTIKNLCVLLEKGPRSIESITASTRLRNLWPEGLPDYAICYCYRVKKAVVTELRIPQEYCVGVRPISH